MKYTSPINISSNQNVLVSNMELEDLTMMRLMDSGFYFHNKIEFIGALPMLVEANLIEITEITTSGVVRFKCVTDAGIGWMFKGQQGKITRAFGLIMALDTPVVTRLVELYKPREPA